MLTEGRTINRYTSVPTTRQPSFTALCRHRKSNVVGATAAASGGTTHRRRIHGRLFISNCRIIVNVRVRYRLGARDGVFSDTPASFNRRPGDRTDVMSLNLPNILPILGTNIISHTLGFNVNIGTRLNLFGAFSHGGCFCPSLPGNCRVARVTGPVINRNCVSIIIGRNRGGRCPGHVNVAHTRLRRSTNGSMRSTISNVANISLGHTNAPLVRVISRPSVHSTRRTLTCVGTVRRLIA